VGYKLAIAHKECRFGSADCVSLFP